MELESIFYFSLLGLLLVSSLIFGIISWRKSKKSKEVVPYTLGKKTIYLKRSEIPHFELMSREEQRKMVVRFDAKVKSGKIVPVYKHGKIIGYIKSNGK